MMSESTAAARATGTFLALEQKHPVGPTGLHVRLRDGLHVRLKDQSLSVQHQSSSVQDRSSSVPRVTPSSGLHIWDFGLVLAEDDLFTQFGITSEDRDNFDSNQWPTMTFINSCLRLMISKPSSESWPTGEIGWDLFRVAARTPNQQSCVWSYRSSQLVEVYSVTAEVLVVRRRVLKVNRR